MKQSDLKRLKKVVELYEKIEKVLDTTYDSLENSTTEYIEFGGLGHERVSTSRLVKDMFTDAINNRKWVQSKIVMIEEQIMGKEASL